MGRLPHLCQGVRAGTISALQMQPVESKNVAMGVSKDLTQ